MIQTITNPGLRIQRVIISPRNRTHFQDELESHEEAVKEEDECEAAAAAAEGHAHPANQDVEPRAVVTSSEPLASERSLFDYGR